MNYVCEFTPVSSGPQPMRLFGAFTAADDKAAIETVQATTLLRHDQQIQADLFRREAGRDVRIWSGLHHLRPARPKLSVVA